MCAQKHVGWKQVQAGAKGVNVIVLGQRSLTCDVWMLQTESSVSVRYGSRGARSLAGSYISEISICESDLEGAVELVYGDGRCWLTEIKREKKAQEKHSTRLKFTRSFPAQGLSKLNRTTQAATYQTACMPGHFYLPLMFVSVTERPHSPQWRQTLERPSVC